MLMRRTVILAKTESTYGTDPTPTVAANAILVKDVSIKVSGDVLERDFIRSVLSSLQFVRGMKEVELSFKTELKGSGTRGTLPTWGWEGVLFKAAGFSETVTGSTSIVWQPVSSSFSSAAIYVYMDGLFHKVLGCRATKCKLNMDVGKYIEVEWTFKGLYAAPTDASPSSQTFSSVVPPTCLSSAFTVGAYSSVSEKLEIDVTNTVAARKDLNAAGGITEQVITGRKVQGSFDPAVVTEATHAFWGNWSAATAIAMNFGPIGATSGNIIQITAPRMQYRDMDYADKNGDLTYKVPFSLAGSAGDDELVITIT